ncbi:hypothetical protein [Devosia nitrariae]|uniref:Uncharacterized protein n=1 Tax=Devosia nitrariae TaxID=2071872 RepID=A0ABQ5W9Z5_9HYPH|nr:hypothetical protein [Devosia nitrariae]GLQ56606.1 hypothetical protein GCM10010862_38650 [Devosia nitrariae]
MSGPVGRRRARRTVISALLAIAALVAVANAHLVYVAVATQPACVDHIKDHGAPGNFRAAKSAC